MKINVNLTHSANFLKKNQNIIFFALIIIFIILAGGLIINRNNTATSKNIFESQQKSSSQDNSKSDGENTNSGYTQNQKTDTQGLSSGGSGQNNIPQDQKPNSGSINTENGIPGNNSTPETLISSWGMDYGTIDDCGNGICVLGESYIITQTFTVPVSSCTGKAVYDFDGYAPDFGRVYSVSVSKINLNTCRLVFSGPDKRGMCIMYLYVTTDVNTPVKQQEFTWQKIWNNN